jgi:hypothetical protein
MRRWRLLRRPRYIKRGNAGDKETTMRIRTPFIPIIAPLLLGVMMCLGGCATIGMEQVKAGMTPTESSDSVRTFNSACLSQAPAGYCEALEQNTVNNSLPFQEFSSHDFKVLDYPIDAGTLFLKMYSPRHTAALSLIKRKPLLRSLA